MEKLELDFYYGRESEQFTFYRLPKALITDERFKGVSNNAKLLYGLMLDRMSLSKKRGWLDCCSSTYLMFLSSDYFRLHLFNLINLINEVKATSSNYINKLIIQ